MVVRRRKHRERPAAGMYRLRAGALPETGSGVGNPAPMGPPEAVFASVANAPGSGGLGLLLSPVASHAPSARLRGPIQEGRRESLRQRQQNLLVLLEPERPLLCLLWILVHPK